MLARWRWTASGRMERIEREQENPPRRDKIMVYLYEAMFLLNKSLNYVKDTKLKRDIKDLQDEYLRNGGTM